MKLKCPKCEQEINIADINMQTDSVLCRSCEEIFNINECTEIIDKEHIKNIYNNPPNGCMIREDFDGKTLIIKKKSLLGILILTIFTLIWSGLSIGSIYVMPILNGKFNVEQGLFGIPFVLGTIILVNVIMCMLFGAKKIKIANGELYYFNGLAKVGIKKRLQVSQIKEVNITRSNIQTNNQYHYQVELKGHFDNNKKVINIVSTTDDEILEYAKAFILVHKK
ncbi:hypothetical protein AAEX28_06170 [Lentisphaerota bacterium WC36G]|nr:hypothetical protein LJT99_09030 [Lentisphaerae bacterium WC36]